MQKVLVHVAMVLLGITLTTGFYEGRRLVKNTAKALDAATTLSTTGGRQAAREGLAGDGEDAEDEDLGALEEDARPAVRKGRIDPAQVGPGRTRVRPPIAAEGGVGEPEGPRGGRRGRGDKVGGGGGGGRRGSKADRVRPTDGPAQVREPVAGGEELPVAIPAEELPLEDTGVP